MLQLLNAPDLIDCVVRISLVIRSNTICCDSIDRDAANDFSEKTNDDRNLHSTLIYLFF